MIFLKQKKSQPLISKRLAQKKQTTFSVACSPDYCFLLFYGSSVPVSLENIRFTSIFRDKNITPLKREKTR